MKKTLLFVLAIVALVFACLALSSCDFAGLSQNDEIGFEYETNIDMESYRITGLGTAIGKDIVIPEKINGYPVTAIAEGVFGGKTGLRSVVIPSGVTEISALTFSGCTSLESVTIPENATRIGNGAFSGCISLKNITIPAKITEIASNAFLGCLSLRSITIPESVTAIGSGAFRGCANLLEVYNLSKLSLSKNHDSAIGEYALNIYTSLSRESKINITDEGFVFYEADDNVLLIGYDGEDTAITLPEDYNGEDYTINNYAFLNNTELNQVELSNGVTKIGDYAFYKCSELESIYVPSSVESIGAYAFGECESLASATFETTNGWYYNSHNKVELSTPENAALLLRSNYVSCVWYKP